MEDFIPTNDDFTPVYSSQQPLPFVGRPQGSGKFTCFMAPDGFVAYISDEVLRTMIEEAKYTDERMGLLAGRVLRDEKGPYTLVLALESAQENEIDASPSRVLLSGPGSIKVRHRLENRAYGLDIIGWYHTHPTFTARFSSVDTIEQSTWSDSNHIGIVVSGLRTSERFGVYRGPKAMALAQQNSTHSSSVRPIPAPNPLLPATKVSAPTELEPERSFVIQPRVATTSWRKRVSRISTGAVVIGTVATIAAIVWFDHRIRKLERPQSESAREITTLRASQPIPNPANSPLAQPGSEDSGSKTGPNREQQAPLAASDLPANPKLPVAKSPDKPKTKKTRVVPDNTKTANRSSRSVGAGPVNTGPVRRIITPNSAPKPSPTPAVRPLPKPLPPPVKDNE
jgi:proteasome lid subunit RPN8/RPN11